MPLMPPEGLSYFRGPITTIVSCSNTSVTQIAQASPDRVLLMFLAGGIAVITISTSPNVSLNSGLKINTAPSLPVVFNWHDHGPIVNAPWYAFAGGASGQPLHIVEVFYQPPGSTI